MVLEIVVGGAFLWSVVFVLCVTAYEITKMVLLYKERQKNRDREERKDRS